MARRLVRGVRARPRLLLAAAIFAAVALVTPDELRLPTRFLAAWDIAITAYLALVMVMMARSDEATLQRRADQEDIGAAIVLTLTMTAAVASFVAIAAELHGLHDAGPGHRASWRLGLAGITILLSWVFVHVMFAMHYAHDYYAGEDDRGGLKFPSDNRPDYWDFLYFAFTMGAASQTSDVSVTASRTRRFVLAHTILSFLFNTTVLALAINVGASLL
jgi:uncharacterized membrane protein